MAINTLKSGDTLPDNIRVFKNGVLYDKTKGRIVGHNAELAQVDTRFDTKRSMDALSNRLELKRGVIAQAAQAAVQSSTLVKAHGSAAWIAEIAQAQMTIATTPDAGVAATKAADWLITNAGIGERQAVDAGGAVSLGGVADLVAELAAFASSVAGLVAASSGNAFDNSNYHNLDAAVEGTQKEGDGVGGDGG